MTLLAAFIALAAALALAAWRKREPEKALAFAFVLCGLAAMGALWGQANGVLAFAIWTVVSYFVLNFPSAATAYLFSAFCYVIEWGGHLETPMQVASNLAGLAGLAAIWYGTPKWRYLGLDRSRPGCGLSVGFDTSARRPSTQRREAQE